MRHPSRPRRAVRAAAFGLRRRRARLRRRVRCAICRPAGGLSGFSGRIAVQTCPDMAAKWPGRLSSLALAPVARLRRGIRMDMLNRRIGAHSSDLTAGYKPSLSLHADPVGNPVDGLHVMPDHKARTPRASDARGVGSSLGRPPVPSWPSARSARRRSAIELGPDRAAARPAPDRRWTARSLVKPGPGDQAACPRDQSRVRSRSAVFGLRAYQAGRLSRDKTGSSP